MIFVSVNPFALKRFFLFLLAAIGFSCVSCFGQSIFLTVKNTPYDQSDDPNPADSDWARAGTLKVTFPLGS